MINKIKWTFQGTNDEKITIKDYRESMFFLGGIYDGKVEAIQSPTCINVVEDAKEQLYEVVKVQRGNGYDAFIAIPKSASMEIEPEAWKEICEYRKKK